MPTNVYTFGDEGAFSINQIYPLSTAKSTEFGNVDYEFMLWYPTIELLEVPDTVSRDVRWYGDKYYLGEVAFQNFGAVVQAQFLQYRRQQFPQMLALPVPIFEAGENIETVNIFNQGFYTGSLRTRDIVWDLRRGVKIRLDVRWLIGRINYTPIANSLAVI